MRLGEDAGQALLAPVAPGVLQACGITASGYMAPDAPYRPVLVQGTLALDGEREIEFCAHDTPTITLDHLGPLSVDVQAVLTHAAQHRLLAVPLGHPLHPATR